MRTPGSGRLVRRALRLALGVFVSVGTIYSVGRGLDLPAGWSAVCRADRGYLALSAGAMLANIGLKIVRWQWLWQAAAESPSLGRLAAALMVGQLGNAILPVRLGDLARIGVSARGQQGGTGLAVLTVAIEKAADSLALLGISLALVLSVGTAPRFGTLRVTLGAGLIVLLAATGILARQTGLRQRLASALRRLPARWIACHLARGVEEIGRFNSLRGARTQVGLWAISSGVWLLAGLVNYFGFRAVGLHSPFSAALLLAVTEIAANNAAYAPAGIGVYHSICVATLAVYGVPAQPALAAAILLHLVVYVPIVVGGLLALWLAALVWQGESAG